MTAAALPLRRTWLVGELYRRHREGTFPRLLKALDPRALARCAGGVESVYQALLAHCETLFPTYDRTDWWREEVAEMEGETYDFAETALGEGIPVTVMGVNDEDVYYGHVPPALALAYVLCGDDWATLDSAPEVLRDLLPKDDLAALLARRDVVKHNVSAPRGRRWTGPWAALPDLVAYVAHHTGCALLDYSSRDVDDLENPPWDLDEIKGLALDWKRGEPVLARVNALVDHIGRDRSRLLDLGRALTGDVETRQRLSRPARPGKTLAQIFTGRR